MKLTSLVLSALFSIIILLLGYLIFQTLNNQKNIKENNKEIAKILENPNKKKLAILWSTADKDVAQKVIFLYINNSKNLWDDLTVFVWGPSAKLLAEDKELQEDIKKIIKKGTIVKACKKCSDSYGMDVSKKLADLGIEVKYITEITDYIKEGRHILFF